MLLSENVLFLILPLFLVTVKKPGKRETITENLHLNLYYYYVFPETDLSISDFFVLFQEEVKVALDD